ncbi:MAG: YHS domain-containing protein [Nitrosopumilaceae archaeon]
MKDPVCGMEVNEKNDFVEYEGKKFHFCCASCRWAFENDPKQFVSKQS